MRRAASVSILSRAITARPAVVMLTLLCLVAAPATVRAQDAGVSGIAPGPANANGLNNSLRDPSGIGNAAKMPPLPVQHSAITPVPAPLVSGSSAGAYRGLRSRPAFVRTRPTRFAKSRHRHKYHRAMERAAVREDDRLLDRKLTTICRVC